MATGRPLAAIRLLGGFELDLSRLPTRFPYVLVTPQYETERVLADRAIALGVEIVRGAEVVDLRQDGDGVEVRARTGDGETVSRRAGWAVGADGVHSTVRRLGLAPPRQAGRAISGLAVRHPAARGSHRLTGRRAPDIGLGHVSSGPTRLYEALRGRRFVLVHPPSRLPRSVNDGPAG